MRFSTLSTIHSELILSKQRACDDLAKFKEENPEPRKGYQGEYLEALSKLEAKVFCWRGLFVILKSMISTKKEERYGIK